MKKTFKYIIAILCITAFVSCDTDDGFEDFTVERTNVIELSGDWYVETFVDGNMTLGYTLMTTSNTANDDTALRIYDHGNIFGLNVAIPANAQDLTFGGVLNIDSETTTITNGMVQKNGTVTSGTNLAADFISFDIEFSDDPGTVYHIEGYKRSGYLEDEH